MKKINEMKKELNEIKIQTRTINVNPEKSEKSS